MGTKGLRGKGWIRKIGEKRYRLTDVGRLAVSDLGRGNSESNETRGGSLARETLRVLTRIFRSRAFQKVRTSETLDFGDVCDFWNISPRSNANQLKLAVLEAEAALKSAQNWLKRQEGGLALIGSRVDIRDVENAWILHRRIQEQFERDLAIIRSRKDERLAR